MGDMRSAKVGDLIVRFERLSETELETLISLLEKACA